MIKNNYFRHLFFLISYQNKKANLNNNLEFISKYF